MFGGDVLSGLGAVAFALAVLAFVPLVRDTLRGVSYPHRATWLIWAVLASISAGASIYEGASVTALFSLTQAAGSILIFLLSLRYGLGPVATWVDMGALAICAIGVGVWYVTSDAVMALTISIGMSALGGTLTLAKCLRAPQSETSATWWLSLAAALCACAAVGEADAVLLAYPAYLAGLYASLILAMSAGRALQGRRLRATVSRRAPMAGL